MYWNLSTQAGISPVADSRRKRSTRGWFFLGGAGIWIWSIGPWAWGGLLIYEPFAYPTGQQLTLSGSGDPLTVPAPSSTQWDGAMGFSSGSEWGIGRQDTGTSIAVGIGPALRFDGLWPEGGSLQVQSAGNFATLARGIGVAYGSGTLWASYLYQAINVGGSSIVDVRFTQGSGNQFQSTNRRFRNLGDASNSASQGGVGGGDSYTAASGPNLNDGRVYLLVAKYTNVGQTGTASWWALTQENYAAVLSMGLTEAALDTHYVDKLVLSDQPARTLTSGDTWLQTPVYQGNALLDHLRYGTSLADVAPPAPVRWISLYQETFPNTTGTGNLPMGQIGWYAYSGANAQDRTNGPVDSGDRVGVSYFGGSPSGSGFGFAVPVGQSEPPRFLVYTTEFTSQFPDGGIPPDDYEQLWFSWRQHTSGENALIRLALRVTDPQTGESWWFASDTAFVNTGSVQTGALGEFPAEAVVRGMLFSPKGSLWRDLTFTAGSTLSLASSARTQDLPSGLITAVGLYLSGPNDTTMRFDTFEIYAMVVPEPNSWVLLALGGLLLSMGRRFGGRKTVSGQGRSCR